MVHRRKRVPLAVPLSLSLAALGGCGSDEVTGTGDPDNVAPTIAPLADRTVIRNTLTPGRSRSSSRFRIRTTTASA